MLYRCWVQIPGSIQELVSLGQTGKDVDKAIPITVLASPSRSCLHRQRQVAPLTRMFVFLSGDVRDYLVRRSDSQKRKPCGQLNTKPCLRLSVMSLTRTNVPRISPPTTTSGTARSLLGCLLTTIVQLSTGNT